MGHLPQQQQQSRCRRDKMTGEVVQVISYIITTKQIYYGDFSVFECYVLGDGADYQGGGGVEKVLNRCSRGEVDDTVTEEDLGGGGEEGRDQTTGATSTTAVATAATAAAAAQQRQQGQDDGGSCAGD